MAISNVGRPRTRSAGATEVVAIPVPAPFKQALEDEVRAAGCRSVAEYLRQKWGWPDVTRRMGPTPKEVHQV